MRSLTGSVRYAKLGLQASQALQRPVAPALVPDCRQVQGLVIGALYDGSFWGDPEHYRPSLATGHPIPGGLERVVSQLLGRADEGSLDAFFILTRQNGRFVT